MSFHRAFKQGMDKANERLGYDRGLAAEVREYAGRSLVFNVTGDAVYVFRFKDRLELDVNPSLQPDDMYLEMDEDKARKMIETQKGSVWDIATGKIKYRNI